MKFALLIFGTLALACGVVTAFLYWYGRRLSKSHRQTCFRVLPASPQQVWDLLAERPFLPQYGQQIESVIAEQFPPSRMVRRVRDEGLSFGGTWTFELERTCEGTRLTITEEGFIRPPILRAIVHLFIGLGKAPEAFLAHLSNPSLLAGTLPR